MTALPADSADRVVASPAWSEVRAPVLSILVPTYDRDIRPLCRELLADMAALPDPAAVELAVLVDGNPALAGQEEVAAAAEAAGLAACVLLAPRNRGRSEARNRLARQARGRFLLFLDADSLPDAPGFVARALALAGDPGRVACGGRSGRRAGPPPSDALLFHAHSSLREWVPPAERNRFPDLAFVSANFLVARDLFLAEPFDPGFTGWGYEDMEWAMRMLRRGVRVEHVDNTVTHDEHHRDADYLARLERSAGNFVRLWRRHPALAERLRILRLVRLLAPVAGWSWLRGLAKAAALTRPLPVRLRLLALKAFQAACFAAAARAGRETPRP